MSSDEGRTDSFKKMFKPRGLDRLTNNDAGSSFIFKVVGVEYATCYDPCI